MTTTAVIDGQWGDTGKGKIVDYLVPLLDAYLVARFGGGDNAGHTVVIEGEVYKHHILPSGIAYPHVLNVVGNGVVVNPVKLVEEMDEMRSRGFEINGPSEDGYGNLLISSKAHIIMPWHIELDELREKSRGDKRIGTTKRGIGPTYMYKSGRTDAIRVYDIIQKERFEKKVEDVALSERNQFEVRLKEMTPWLFERPDFREMVEKSLDSHYNEFAQKGKEVYEYCQQLIPYVGDCSAVINEYVNEGKGVIFEGAQGTLLDIDHGTYPYVTSSNPTKGGIYTGTGFGGEIDKVVLVAKAYTTRVGRGAFPSELTDEIGERIRKVGKEYGTTTGRPRRVGWIDTVILRYSSSINKPDETALMKLDVLCGAVREAKFCYAYEIDGTETTKFPVDDEVLRRAMPKYMIFKDWPKMTTQELMRSSKNGRFPKVIQSYLDTIEDETGVPISIVSVGPQRNETILLT